MLAGWQAQGKKCAVLIYRVCSNSHSFEKKQLQSIYKKIQAIRALTRKCKIHACQPDVLPVVKTCFQHNLLLPGFVAVSTRHCGLGEGLFSWHLCGPHSWPVVTCARGKQRGARGQSLPPSSSPNLLYRAATFLNFQLFGFYNAMITVTLKSLFVL